MNIFARGLLSFLLNLLRSIAFLIAAGVHLNRLARSLIAKMFIFSYRRMIMAYSPDFRKKVLETLSRGLSVRTTAALFGIHFTTIQNWKKHPEKAKTPQKRPPKKIRTEELLADIEMYPTDYLSERAKRFKCIPVAIRKAMLRNKFGAVLD